MASRPDASAYPVAGVRHARRVSSFSAACLRPGERGLRAYHGDAAPTPNLQNRSAGVDVDPDTLPHTHLPFTGQQVHAARHHAAALTTAPTHRPNTPVKRSGT